MGQNISMRQLKEQRLTPAEKFVLKTIKGVKPKEPDKIGNIVWYKDGIFLFKQEFKHGVLRVNYKPIWSVLEKQYGLNSSEIQQLIGNILSKYHNNFQINPSWIRYV